MEHNAASPVKNNELEQALGVWGRGNGRGRGPRGVGGEGGGARRGGGGGGAGAGDGAVPPTLLITTKQFRPYRKAQTVFSGSGVEGQSNDRCVAVLRQAAVAPLAGAAAHMLPLCVCVCCRAPFDAVATTRCC